MKHLPVPAKHLRATLPVVGMRRLLEERKAGLEAQVKERFRAARANGATADVKMLSATLRALKRQIAKAKGDATKAA